MPAFSRDHERTPHEALSIAGGAQLTILEWTTAVAAVAAVAKLARGRQMLPRAVKP